MTRGVYLVFTNPVSPEREDDYNDYYANVHIPEVVQSDGIVSARRFKLSDSKAPIGPVGDFQYVTIYELESDDLAADFEKHQARRDRGELASSDAMGSPATYAVFELLDEHQPG